MISIQGKIGSFHDIVADDVFGKDAKTLHRENFEQVFEDVASEKAEHGIIAIENSLIGSLVENYDLLLEYDLSIVGEYYLPIQHHLMALPGTKLEDITEVISHPAALKQCKNFLRKYSWKVTQGTDTAGAVEMIAEKQLRNVAAIGGEHLASMYGLEILEENIETNRQNFTRFLIISKTVSQSSENNKTSMVFEAGDTPGSLVRILQAFADKQINLSKIESRPILGDAWNYNFFIDFEAGIQDPKVEEVLTMTEQFVEWKKILGSYKSNR